MTKSTCRLPTIILCGGKGTRFQSVSKLTPKALAPVGSAVMLDIIVRMMQKQGISSFIFATGHLSHEIEKHVTSYQDIHVKISREERPLGTGGALRQASQLVKDDNILAVNGDTFLNLNIDSFYKAHLEWKADLTICLTTARTQDFEYGGVRLDDSQRVTHFGPNEASKFNFINAGAYIIKRTIFSDLLENESSLEFVDIPRWIKNKNIYGFVTDETLFDIGTPERYHKFLKHQEKSQN